MYIKKFILIVSVVSALLFDSVYANTLYAKSGSDGRGNSFNIIFDWNSSTASIESLISTYFESPKYVLSHICLDTGGFLSQPEYADDNCDNFGLTLFDISNLNWIKASYSQNSPRKVLFNNKINIMRSLMGN
jgi:hypothetical protein